MPEQFSIPVSILATKTVKVTATSWAEAVRAAVLEVMGSFPAQDFTIEAIKPRLAIEQNPHEEK